MMDALPPFPVVIGEVAGIPFISDPGMKRGEVRIVHLDALPNLKREVEKFRWYRKRLTGHD